MESVFVGSQSCVANDDVPKLLTSTTKLPHYRMNYHRINYANLEYSHLISQFAEFSLPIYIASFVKNYHLVVCFSLRRE